MKNVANKKCIFMAVEINSSFEWKLFVSTLSEQVERLKEGEGGEKKGGF